MRNVYLWLELLGSDFHGFPSPFLLQSYICCKLHKIPEMAEELLENSVLALYCLHNDLHHVCAVTVGMIWKDHQSHFSNVLQQVATLDTDAQSQGKT